jgi:hypothetical protein
VWVFASIIFSGVAFAAAKYDLYLECSATQLVRRGVQPDRSHIVWGLSFARRIAAKDLEEQLPLVIEENFFKIGGWGSPAESENRIQAIVDRYTGDYSLLYYFSKNSGLSQFTSLFEGSCSKASPENYQKKF